MSVGWLIPMWDLFELDITYVGHFLHALGVEVVSEVREFFITSTFSIILCRCLTVHLVNPAPWLTKQVSKKVDIIDLTRAGDGLVCLVYTLKRGGQETIGRTDVCAALFRSFAGIPVIYSTISGLYFSTFSRKTFNPTTCLKIHPSSIQEFSNKRCWTPLSTAMFVPILGAKCTIAFLAVSESRGSITIRLGGSGPSRRFKTLDHKTVWVAAILCCTTNKQSVTSMSV